MSEPRTLGEMVDAGEPFAYVFDLLRQLAEARGWLPVGFRRMELPDGFIVTVNGTKDAHCDEIGVPVPPYDATVIRHGWPLGSFDMFGGVLMAGAEAGLVRAFEQALNEPASVAAVVPVGGT